MKIISTTPVDITKQAKAFGIPEAIDVHVPANTPFDLPDSCAKNYLKSHPQWKEFVESEETETKTEETKTFVPFDIPQLNQELGINEEEDEDSTETEEKTELPVEQVTGDAPYKEYQLKKMTVQEVSDIAAELGINPAGKTKTVLIAEILA